jgi:hypothetical protein
MIAITSVIVLLFINTIDTFNNFYKDVISVNAPTEKKMLDLHDHCKTYYIFLFGIRH